MSHNDVIDPAGLQDEPDEPLRRAVEGETAATHAPELIAEFIAAANRSGATPEPLRAQLTEGGTARTDKRGWYIKVDHSVAIGDDGQYYRLTVAGGMKERVSGVRLQPSTPDIWLGEHSDAQQGELADFLTRALGRKHGEYPKN